MTTPTKPGQNAGETADILSDIEQRAKKATPGPWITGSIPWKVWANGGYNTVCDVGAVGDETPVAPGLATSESMARNRDFIAHARTDVPRLVKALRRALEELDYIERRKVEPGPAARAALKDAESILKGEA